MTYKSPLGTLQTSGKNLLDYVGKGKEGMEKAILHFRDYIRDPTKPSSTLIKIGHVRGLMETLVHERDIVPGTEEYEMLRR